MLIFVYNHNFAILYEIKSNFIYSIIITFFCFTSFFENVSKQNENVTNNCIVAKQVEDFSKKQTNFVSFEAVDVDYDEELHNDKSKNSEKNNDLVFLDNHSKYFFQDECLLLDHSFNNISFFTFKVNKAIPLYLNYCQIII